jgi:hypothetical protein
MIKTILLSTFISVGFCVSAQSVSPSVIASGGTYATSTSGSLSYTVGELSAVTTLSSGASILTQGFQQADIDQGNAILDLESNEKGSMIVYPNPAEQTFTVGYKFPVSGDVKLNMYDATGKLVTSVLENEYASGNAVYNYDCSQLASGNYTLKLEYISKTAKMSYTLEEKLIIIK